MTLGIMQPYLFPYTGYFQLINAADQFIVYDDVNYIKGGWINRNKILLNGKEYVFCVPLKHASSFNKISETIIDKSLFEKWKVKFLKTLEQAYKKAPYFEKVNQLVIDVLNTNYPTISQLASESIQGVCNYLSIGTPVSLSSIVYNNSSLKSAGRVIDICKKQDATNYINPIGGTELYSKEIFLINNIVLNFIKSRSIVYNQFQNEFVPGLSIIDTMMFNSVSDIGKMLNEYDYV